MRFADQGTEDIFNGLDTKAARQTLPRELWKIAQRKLDMLQVASRINDLKMPPGNRLKALSGDLKGYYSIRINDQYRIVFRWDEREGPKEVRITDYH